MLGVFGYNYSARTDDRGRFRFDRVIPGHGTVSRSVITEMGPGGPWRHMQGWPVWVDVKPGQVVQVTIGGKGRPVIGRIILDGIPESPIDWTRNDPVEVGRFASHIDKEGRFRIEDVPAGVHKLASRSTRRSTPGSAAVPIRSADWT